MSATRRDFKDCNGELAEKVTRLLMAMDCLGHPIFIVETFRSQERQDEPSRTRSPGAKPIPGGC
jgi:hypothetical protein